MATSKFFRGDTDSESSSGSSSSSDDERAPQPKAAQKQKTGWVSSDSSDDGEQAKRVIRSHKDKRFASLQDLIKTMRNHMKINDYSSLLQDYEGSRKMLTKLMAQPGGGVDDTIQIPLFFIKAISDLAEHIDTVHASGAAKKFPTNKAKAYNTLRAKVRKGNLDYEDQLTHLRENPEEYEDEPHEEDVESEDEESSESSDEDSSPVVVAAKPKAKGKTKDDAGSSSSGDSDDDSGSDSDTSSYSESSESSEDSDMDEEMLRARRRRRWLKTEADYEAERREQELRDRVAKLAEERAAKKKAKTDAGKDPKVRSSAGQNLDADEMIKRMEDPENKIHELKTVELKKRIVDIVQIRGRKVTDRRSYEKKIKFYLDVAREFKHGPACQVYLMAQQVVYEFDSYSGAWFENLSLERWEKSYNILQTMFEVVQGWQPEEDAPAEGEAGPEPTEHDDTFTFPAIFRGFILAAIKLDDELYKALQFSTKENQEFLIVSCKMTIFLKDLLHYLLGPDGARVKESDTSTIPKLASRLLEHIYYKTDTDNRMAFKFMEEELGYEPAKRPDNLGDWSFEGEASFELLSFLCQVIESGSVNLVTERVFTLRGQLCRAYHLALHNKFRPARDILHFMNLYEKSLEVETHTQILYNRAFAQVGLCAFRLGLIPEAHHYLMELCTYNKSKELLAQGVAFQRFNERNPEQEKTERRRQLPYHMHIPLDHLDAAHLICALLLEVPNMLIQQLNPGHRRLISKALRKYLDAMDKHIFQTPPETCREYILHAAMAVQRGDWHAAVHTHLKQVKFLAELIDIEMLEQKVKEESLRCYCLKHASSYESLDLDTLTKMFQLSSQDCHSIASKMILEGEVHLAWDDTSRILIVKHEDSHTKFQRLTQTLAEKCANQLEQHERVVDYKTGNYTKQNEQGGGLYQGLFAQHGGFGMHRGSQTGGFRDVSSEEVRHFNRTRYGQNVMRGKGGIVAGGGRGGKFGKGGGKGDRQGGGKGYGKEGKEGGKRRADISKRDGMQNRAAGWNRGARDFVQGFAWKPEDQRGGNKWGQQRNSME